MLLFRQLLVTGERELQLSMGGYKFVVEEVAKSEFRFDFYLPLVTRAFSCLLLLRMPGSCFGLSACAIICVTPADH